MLTMENVLIYLIGGAASIYMLYLGIKIIILPVKYSVKVMAQCKEYVFYCTANGSERKDSRMFKVLFEYEYQGKQYSCESDDYYYLETLEEKYPQDTYHNIWLCSTNPYSYRIKRFYNLWMGCLLLFALVLFWSSIL